MDLATALQRTFEEATPRTQGVFGGEHGMSAEEVTDFINEYPVALISSVDSSGAPHVTGKGVVLKDGRIYFAAAPTTAMGRNLRRNQAVALAFAEPPWKRHVLVRGTVRFVEGGSEQEAQLSEAHIKSVGWPSTDFAEVENNKVYTWKD